MAVADPTYGWPFLVARGRRKGFRTVLAPAFLVERRQDWQLAEAIDGGPPRSAGARTAELDAAVGLLTIVYQTEPLAAEDLDELPAQADRRLTDEHGRPLEVVYGIVARGRLREEVDPGDLRDARSQAIASYVRFLDDEDGFDVDRSTPFPLRGVRGAAADGAAAAPASPGSQPDDDGAAGEPATAPAEIGPPPANDARTATRAEHRRTLRSPQVIAAVVVAIVLIVAGLVIVLTSETGRQASTQPRIVASTSWVASLVRAAGAKKLALVAPAQLSDPAGYHPSRSDLARAHAAHLVFYSRADRFAKALEHASSDTVLVAVELENSPTAIHAAVVKIARALKTRAAAARWLKRFDTTYAALAHRVRTAVRSRSVRAVTHVRLRSWARFAGIHVVGTYGPAALTPVQIARLGRTRPDLVLDDAVSPIGRALDIPGATLVSLVNAPAPGLDLLDVFRRNARVIENAVKK